MNPKQAPNPRIHRSFVPMARPILPALLTLTVLLLAACGGPQKKPLGPPTFGPDLRQSPAPGTTAAAWKQWLTQGDAMAASDDFESLGDDPLARFGLAEIHLHQGRYSQAAAAHADLIGDHPGSKLAHYSALRLHQLRRAAAGWPDAASKALTSVQGQPLATSTRAYMGLVALETAHRIFLQSDQAAPFDGTAQGLVDQWRLAGPLSLYPFYDHDTAYPDTIEDQPALPESVTVDGFERQSRTVRFETPDQGLPLSHQGIFYLESWVTLDKARSVLAQLKTSTGIKVWIDDALIFENNLLRDGYPAHRAGAPLELGAGTYRIRVRLVVERGDETFQLLLTPADGAPLALKASPTAPDDRAAGKMTTTAKLPTKGYFGSEKPLQDHPFVLWMTAVAAHERHDPHLARRALDRLDALAPDFPPALVTRGLMERDDTSNSALRRRDVALEAFATAATLDPTAGMAALQVTDMLLGAGQSDEAEPFMAMALDNAPQEPTVLATHYDLLLNKGWSVAAAKTLKRALEIDPGDCSLVAAQWGRWSELDQWPTPQSLPEAAARCDISQENLALNHDLPRGDLAAAIARYERLVARQPSGLSMMLTLATLYQRDGRDKEAQATFERLLKATGGSADALALHFDALMASKGPKEASKMLEGWVEQHPGSYGLRRLNALASGTNVLEDLRIDGQAVIKEYLKDPKFTDTSGVYLLDYAAVRIYPDGSNLTVTHNIIRVNNKEGIDNFGEVELPQDALLLQIRTVKPDGRVLEPEFIAGKPSISMPNLAEGDFIEYEYLQGSSGNEARKGAYGGVRFFFNIFDAPLLRSEYIIDAPKSWQDVHVDYRQDAPKALITERGQWRRWRFLTVEGPQARSEPASVPNVEVLPSIRLSHKLQWADAHRLYRDRVLSGARPDGRLKAVAAQLKREHKSPAARAKAAFKYVLANIDDDGSGLFSATASQVLSGGRGDRMIVLRALLNLLDIPNDVALARPWGRDQTLGPVPETDNWDFTILRASVGDNWVWLDPTLNHSIFGHISPSIQGNKALLLAALESAPTIETLFVDVPTLAPEADMRTITLDAQIAQDGTLTGKVTETYTGTDAIQLRRVVDEYTDLDELREGLAGAMTDTFPGLEITTLDFENAKDTTKPLIMRYSVRSPGFARVENGALLVEQPFFATGLAQQYATLPRRRQPVAILSPTRVTLEARLVFPDGHKAELDAGQVNALKGDFGQIRTTSARNEGPNVLALRRVLDVPIQRVAPKAYESFRRFAVGVGQLETLRLRSQ